jgi:flagellar L-ring protein FlgH
MRVEKWMLGAGAAALALTCVATTAAAQNTTNYDELYNRYLTSARRNPDAGRNLWMVDMTADLRARNVNDLVTIRVIETLSASGSADANIDKAGSASVSLPAGRVADALAKAFPVASDTTFKGSGGTTRTTTLQAVITARVVEVLPSGDLVVEGVREVDINGDRSVVVLSGVIRAVDIQQGNVILSTQIGQLRIRSLSAGLIRDSLSPGWLIRLLNKVF